MESIYCLTQLCGGEIYIILLLHREQLHVSALYNGHLQVVHELLNKKLYKHIYIYIYWMMPTIDLSIIRLRHSLITE